MPLTGSDKAYRQARSGIARSGATRSGYISTVNGVVTVNGVNRSTSIIMASLDVNLALNDEPDTCRFTMKPGATIPIVGQTVVVAIGASSNPIFSGQAVSVTHRRRHKVLTPFVDVECIDWTALFDRCLLCTEYSSQSASTIAVAIVSSTSGFTSTHVQSGLPTVDYFPLTNEKPSVALRRLVTLMGGGGFYIDPNRDVHVFGVAGEIGPLAPTNPQTLTNSQPTLKSFIHRYDYSQVRNKVIAEGQRTTCPLSIPANVTLPTPGFFPVEDASIFNAAGGIARVGTERITYTNTSTPMPFGDNPQGARTTANAAIGATTVLIDSNAWIAATGTSWCRIGEQVIFFTGSGGTDITGIPASGFGSIQAAIGTGASLTAIGTLVGVTGLMFSHPAGVDVVIRVELNDTAAQTALAVIEGGDGIHEHVISDGRLNEDGLIERAQADLDAFSDPLTQVTFETTDMNAHPGAQQVINLTTTDVLSTTLTITHVNLTFPAPNLIWRRCDASTVRLARFADMADMETA